MGLHGSERFCMGPKLHWGKMGTREWVTKEVYRSRNGHQSKWVLGGNEHWQAADTWKNWHWGKKALKQVDAWANEHWG